MSALTKQQQVEHAKLAVDVYLDREERGKNISDWERYDPKKEGDHESSGLTAEAYKSTCGTNEIVFAIGGTNDADDILPDASFLVPTLLRGNAYSVTISLHSHAGAWERVSKNHPVRFAATPPMEGNN